MPFATLSRAEDISASGLTFHSWVCV